MKKSKKVKMICSVIIALSFLITSPAYAAEQINSDGEIQQSKIIMTNKLGTQVEVNFADLDADVTYGDIQSIIDDHPQDTLFTIHETGGVKNAYSNTVKPVTRAWNPPLFSTHKYETEKTITTAERAVRDDFIISVARGETVTLSKEYSGTLKGSIVGEYFNKANLGINLSITCKYSKSQKFEGPTQTNSREYRVKYYQVDGKYIQRDYCYKPNGSLYGIQSHGGTYKEATRYVSYSVDKNY